MKKLKPTIKELLLKIEHLEATRDQYYSKIRELETWKDEHNKVNTRRQDGIIESFDRENRNLMEIIRWSMNPDTARQPFAPIVRKDESLPDVNRRSY